MFYDIILGASFGKFNCPLHDGDNTPSLHVSDTGLWHCFGCNAGGGSAKTFAEKYYNINSNLANQIITRFNQLPHYLYGELSQQDKDYLTSIGISPKIQKQFFKTVDKKLVYVHKYKGIIIDHTWFNYKDSIVYDTNKGKYNRDYKSVSGFLTPANLLINKTIIIVEGEKDMLTMLSNGIAAVSIVGGTNTFPYMMQRELKNKDIVIIYDCDEAGKSGANKLTHWLYSIGVNTVRNVDLKLNDKEDINDWFVKYKLTKEDLIKVIKQTPIATNVGLTSYKVLNTIEQIKKQLTKKEQKELIHLLNKEENLNGKN